MAEDKPLTPEELEKARKRQKELAAKLDVGNKVVGFVLPEILRDRALGSREREIISAGVAAVQSLAVGVATDNWFGVVEKLGALLKGFLKDPAPDPMRQLIELVTEVKALLVGEYDQERATRIQHATAAAGMAAMNAGKIVQQAGSDVSALAKVNYEEVNTKVSEVFAALQTLIHVGGVDKDAIPAEWNRWWRTEEIAALDWNNWYSPDAPANSAPLTEKDHLQFDYRQPLPALVYISAQLLAVMTLRDPFFRTTGWFSAELRKTADAIERSVLPRIDGLILVTRPPVLALSGWINDAALDGEPSRFRWVGYPAGALNAATGEVIWTNRWSPGMHLRTTPGSDSYEIYGAAGGTGWAPPGERSLAEAQELDRIARALHGDFVATCVEALRDRLPSRSVTRLVDALRTAAATPMSSETFRSPEALRFGERETDRAPSGTARITLDNQVYLGEIAAGTGRARLVRYGLSDPGGPADPVAPAAAAFATGAVVQWPQFSGPQNQAVPITYRIRLRSIGTDGAWTLTDIGPAGAPLEVQGADPIRRALSGEVGIRARRVQILTGRPADRQLTVETPAGAIELQPAPVPVELPEFDDLAPFDDPWPAPQSLSRIVPGDIAEIRVRWWLTIEGGQLRIELQSDGADSISDFDLVIEERQVERWREGEPLFTPPPLSTSIPVTLIGTTIAMGADYWQAVRQKEEEWLAAETQLWQEIGAVAPKGPIYEVDRERARVLPKVRTPDDFVQLLPGAWHNPRLQATLNAHPNLAYLLADR